MEDPFGLKMEYNQVQVTTLAQLQDPTKLKNIQGFFSEKTKFQKNQLQQCHLDSVLELHVYF